jgi:YHS domain-containing protein
MIRNLLFSLLILALYQLWRGFSTTSKTKNISPKNGLEQIDDEMVKDPSCQVYIPKSSAIKSRIAGQEYYFCSPTCAKKFKEQAQ